MWSCRRIRLRVVSVAIETSKASSAPGARQLSDVATAGGCVARRAVWMLISATSRSVMAARSSSGRFYLEGDLPTSEEMDEVVRKYITGDRCRRRVRTYLRGTNAGVACTFPRARPLRGTSNRPTSLPSYFDTRRRPFAKDIAGARVRVIWEQRDGSHLAGRFHQAKQPCRSVPGCAWREAGRLQLLWIAPRRSAASVTRALSANVRLRDTTSRRTRKARSPPSCPAAKL